MPCGRGYTPNSLVGPGGVETPLNRRAIACFTRLVWVHGVLKWLHQVLLKNVILSQPVVSWHDSLHFSTLGSFPGDCCM